MNAFHNGGRLPLVGEVLMCSEAWGCPPWAVIGGNDDPASRWKWFLRWKYYNQQRLLAQRRPQEQ